MVYSTVANIISWSQNLIIATHLVKNMANNLVKQSGQTCCMLHTAQYVLYCTVLYCTLKVLQVRDQPLSDQGESTVRLEGGKMTRHYRQAS